MPFENIVGLHVVDEGGYQAYRAEMIPILETYGGYFRYDFAVSNVLKGEAKHPINRVFIIVFPDRDAQKRFYADPAYVRARQTFFVPSVDGITRLAEYDL